MINHRRNIKNSLFLISGILISALAVSIYVASNFGVSTVSSIPLILSAIVPSFSLGFATILFQIVLILILCYLYKFQLKYLASLFLGIFFGVIVDLCNQLWTFIPIYNLPNVVIFLIALFLLPFGISLTVRSNLTALPFDLIISDLALYSKQSVANIKLWFDIICVIITLVLSYAFFKTIIGIGLGTILSMLVNGKLLQFYLKMIPATDKIENELVDELIE